jgi:3-hydroxypropanoate dehydrogenase
MMEAKDTVVQTNRISDSALNQLFREARTHTVWLPKAVPLQVVKEVYELAKMGPTSANCIPGRFVFLTTEKGKNRLLPALAPGNVEKTRSAPVTAVIAWDTEFYELLPRLFPQAKMRDSFAGNQAVIEETGLRNASLQGAYFILAARALGLDCGPMSGFNAAKVNAEFFGDGKWKVNFLCNFGYGDHSKLYPRNPRLDFEEACLVL